jgi:hypothetical protein
MIATAGTTLEIRSATSPDIWSLETFIRLVGSATPGPCPFDETAVAFCTALSAELLGSVGGSRNPQLVALGYWLRPASIEQMRRSLETLASARSIIVPRGRAFHVTPANVDTMFAYSWILGLLAGNANIVRLSSHATDLAARLLTVISEVIGDSRFDQLRGRNWLVRFGRDDAVSRELSAIADIRVLWGGNATIEHFRNFPLPPRGRDVVFPNRHSMTIIATDAVEQANDEELASAADRFFNDAYSFDQAACSSPRLVIWAAASEGDDTAAARRRFRAAVSEAIRRRGYQAELGTAINKMVFGLRRAAASEGVRYERVSNEETWIEIPTLRGYDRDHCGGGLFFEYVSRDLGGDLERFVVAEDQSAMCFGLGQEELNALARRLNGRGIDRWVPLGSALDFNASWDGYDLLQEFVKRVTVRA